MKERIQTAEMWLSWVCGDGLLQVMEKNKNLAQKVKRMDRRVGIRKKRVDLMMERKKRKERRDERNVRGNEVREGRK